MKNVISFSLWGETPQYIKSAVKNVTESKLIYPGWICRFYVDDTVPLQIIEQLKYEGAEICYCERNKGADGMFWRFMVNDDTNVERYIIRDTDSLVNYRESAAVNEWMLSKKQFHIMRDHPVGHRGEVLGGMWGGTTNIINMTDLIKRYLKTTTHIEYGADMAFLRDYVYPIIRDNAIQHDEYHNNIYKNSIPYPKHAPLSYGAYVGQRIPELDNGLYPLFNKLFQKQKLKNYKYRQIINVERTNEDCQYMKDNFWNKIRLNLVDDFIYNVLQTTNKEIRLTDSILIVSNTFDNKKQEDYIVTTK